MANPVLSISNPYERSISGRIGVENNKAQALSKSLSSGIRQDMSVVTRNLSNKLLFEKNILDPTNQNLLHNKSQLDVISSHLDSMQSIVGRMHGITLKAACVGGSQITDLDLVMKKYAELYNSQLENAKFDNKFLIGALNYDVNARSGTKPDDVFNMKLQALNPIIGSDKINTYFNVAASSVPIPQPQLQPQLHPVAAPAGGAPVIAPPQPQMPQPQPIIPNALPVASPHSSPPPPPLVPFLAVQGGTRVSIKDFGIDRLMEIATVIQSVAHISSVKNDPKATNDIMLGHIRVKIQQLKDAHGNDVCNKVYDAILDAFDPSSGSHKNCGVDPDIVTSCLIHTAGMSIIVKEILEIIDFNDELSKVIVGLVLSGMSASVRTNRDYSLSYSAALGSMKGILKGSAGTKAVLKYLQGFPSIDQDGAIAKGVQEEIENGLDYLNKNKGFLYKGLGDVNKYGDLAGNAKVIYRTVLVTVKKAMEIADTIGAAPSPSPAPVASPGPPVVNPPPVASPVLPPVVVPAPLAPPPVVDVDEAAKRVVRFIYGQYDSDIGLHMYEALRVAATASSNVDQAHPDNMQEVVSNLQRSIKAIRDNPDAPTSSGIGVFNNNDAFNHLKEVVKAGPGAIENIFSAAVAVRSAVFVGTPDQAIDTSQINIRTSDEIKETEKFFVVLKRKIEYTQTQVNSYKESIATLFDGIEGKIGIITEINSKYADTDIVKTASELSAVLNEIILSFGVLEAGNIISKYLLDNTEKTLVPSSA